MSNQTAFAVLEKLCQPVWVYDADRARIHWCNAAGLGVWRAESLHELQERELGPDMSPGVSGRLRQYQADFERDDAARFFEAWTLYPRGEPVTTDVVFNAFRLDDGRMALLIEVLKSRELEPDALRSAEALLHTPVMITLYDTSGEALYRNPAARADLRDDAKTLLARFEDDNAFRYLVRDLNSSGLANTTTSVRSASGTRWYDIDARRCFDAVTGDDAWLVSEVDVTGLKETEERAQFLAQHDPLTRLPNRNYIAMHFADRLAAMRAQGEQGAVIFIDLDNFKTVNDSLGHAAGDRLLVATARRLRNAVREQDIVVRLGGDEFLLLVAAENIVAHVNELAARIADLIGRPVRLLGRDARVTPTLGVSLFPHDGDDIETLMRHADLAVYEAKETGRNKMVFFTPELNTAVQSRMELESDVRDALRDGGFQVFYQPRLDIETDAVHGAEALARWRHPAQGWIPPAKFIPLCEELGLIHELGLMVFTEVAQQQARWSRLYPELIVSTNLSAMQLRTGSLAEELREICLATGAEPSRIELEITESVLLGHDAKTVAALEALAELGFRVAIDDFGTGYSNLAYLHRYRLDCLKIDGSFVAALGHASAVTDMILSMAKLLDLGIVAEGVETHEQLMWLRERGCKHYQGFLHSPALPAASLTEMLIERTNIDTTVGAA